MPFLARIVLEGTVFLLILFAISVTERPLTQGKAKQLPSRASMGGSPFIWGKGLLIGISCSGDDASLPGARPP